MTWRVHPNNLDVLAVHIALLHDGRILIFPGDQHSGDVNALNSTRIWDPATGLATPTTSPDTDVFCGGHAFLGDGRLLVAGGTEEYGTGPGGDPNHPHGLNFGGQRAAWIYLPRKNEWQRVADMHLQPGRPTGGGRWYPSLVTLGNGEVCAFSGHPSRRLAPGAPAGTMPPGDERHQNDTPERYSPGNFWTILPSGVWTGTEDGNGFYPRVHLLRNGTVYIGAPIDGTFRLYDPFAGALTAPPIASAGGWYESWHAVSVLLPLLHQDGYVPRILVAGESGNSSPKRLNLGAMTEPGGSPSAPAWGPAGTRPNGEDRLRLFSMGVLLPTGQVLVCGGVFDADNDLAIAEAELYTPPVAWNTTGTFDDAAAGTWEATGPATVVRNYHSVALLMLDGTVWTAGSSKRTLPGNPADDNVAEKRIEIYSPPYVGQPRQTLSNVPSFIRHGETFDVTASDAANVRRVAFMRCGSFTHAFDGDQRYVSAVFSHGGGSTLTITAPPNGNVAPPGNYMLWIVDAAGNPCARASIIRLAPSRAFILSNRSTFSSDEVTLLAGTSPMFADALYFVVEGLLPSEVATLPATPTISFHLDTDASPATGVISSPAPAGPAWEVPPADHPDIPQRATWTVHMNFADTSVFAGDSRDVYVKMQLGRYAAQARLRLTQQPYPYMLDGPVEWLSIDTRVFRIRPGEGTHGITYLNSDTPFTFLQRQLNHFNTTGAAAFDNIPKEPDDSPLDLSRVTNPGGTPNFNYAFAKVRYRASSANAENVRVFFRMFNTVGTAFEFQTGSEGAYRRAGEGVDARPLLGLQSGNIVSIPFFSEPRVTPGGNMALQPDGLNVRTMTPATVAGQEFVWHFGAWLDINQLDVHFPEHPATDGMFNPADCRPIQTLVADTHQCLVCEVYFDPPGAAPPSVQFGDSPSSSDKLSQRNLAFVRSGNPGSTATRTVQHTFEIKPSGFQGVTFLGDYVYGPLGYATHQRYGPDELIFRWNSLPRRSIVTLYMPSIDAADILRIAATRPGPPSLELVDARTVRLHPGDLTWVPIPGGPDVNIAGLLTIELPAGVTHGERYAIVVQQYAGATRQIIGAFEVKIDVRHEDQLLPREVERLSLLRYIFESMSTSSRWYPVFLRYLGQVADRVDGFGGNADDVAPSPDGTGKESEEKHERCCRRAWIVPLLLAFGIALIGSAPVSWIAPLIVLFVIGVVAAYCLWRRDCRPDGCDVLHALLLGTTVGAGALAIAALFGAPVNPIVAGISVIASAIIAVTTVLRGCWGSCCCTARRRGERWWQKALPRIHSATPKDLATKISSRPSPPIEKPAHPAAAIDLRNGKH